MSKVLEMWQGMTGTVLPFALATAPDGWMLCDGTALAAGTADNLRAKLLADGSPYGDDGSGNPNLPDMRGEFVRGLDGGRGVDAGRALGSAQGDAIRNITGGTAPSGNGLLITFINTPDPSVATGAFGISNVNNTATTESNANTSGEDSSFDLDFDASRVVPTAEENRPRNVAMNYIIKT